MDATSEVSVDVEPGDRGGYPPDIQEIVDEARATLAEHTGSFTSRREWAVYNDVVQKRAKRLLGEMNTARKILKQRRHDWLVARQLSWMARHRSILAHSQPAEDVSR